MKELKFGLWIMVILSVTASQVIAGYPETKADFEDQRMLPVKIERLGVTGISWVYESDEGNQERGELYVPRTACLFTKSTPNGSEKVTWAYFEQHWNEDSWMLTYSLRDQKLISANQYREQQNGKKAKISFWDKVRILPIYIEQIDAGQQNMVSGRFEGKYEIEPGYELRLHELTIFAQGKGGEQEKFLTRDKFEKSCRKKSWIMFYYETAPKQGLILKAFRNK